MRKWIEPAEAFRLLMRSRYPDHKEAADGITSSAWFRERMSIDYEDGKKWPAAITDAAYAPAREALAEIKMHIQEGRIRLRGELDRTKPPSDIDEVDAAKGELFFWDSPPHTAEPYRHEAGDLVIKGRGRPVDRVYRLVHVSVEDLTNTLASTAIIRIASGSRLLAIVNEELSSFQQQEWPERESYVSHVKGKYDLSGIEAESVVKMIWDGTGPKGGRPAADKSKG